jgi:methionine-S-sulfoxide reductase
MITMSACTTKGNDTMADQQKIDTPVQQTSMTMTPNPNADTATFAGGCFWCMQPPFDSEKGVLMTTVGYTGGPEKNPTYEQVGSGATGHAESVQIIFDNTLTSYQHLLDIFWRNIDPTQVDGQFADQGRQYRTAIFYHNDEQRKLAEASKEQLAKSEKFDAPITTEITAATTYWPAEEYHQMYFKKNYEHYKRYRKGSGREGFLEKTWGSR